MISHVIKITSARGTWISSGVTNIVERKVCPIEHVLETSGNIRTAILIGLYSEGVAVHTVCCMDKDVASFKCLESSIVIERQPVIRCARLNELSDKE